MMTDKANNEIETQDDNQADVQSDEQQQSPKRKVNLNLRTGVKAGPCPEDDPDGL